MFELGFLQWLELIVLSCHLRLIFKMYRQNIFLHNKHWKMYEETIIMNNLKIYVLGLKTCTLH